jgi:hypothetical protein
MPKVVSLPAPAPGALTPNEVDEYRDLSEKRDLFQLSEKRYQALREKLKVRYANEPGDLIFAEVGMRSRIDVSIASTQTTVNIRAAYKKLGVGKFLAICSVTLKALGDLLTVPEIADLTSTSRTGSRSFSVTPLGAPAQAPVPQGIANRSAKPDAA